MPNFSKAVSNAEMLGARLGCESKLTCLEMSRTDCKTPLLKGRSVEASFLKSSKLYFEMSKPAGLAFGSCTRRGASTAKAAAGSGAGAERTGAGWNAEASKKRRAAC